MADELTIVETGSVDHDEIDAPGEQHLSEKEEHSPYLVRWDGPNDPENPKVSVACFDVLRSQGSLTNSRLELDQSATMVHYGYLRSHRLERHLRISTLR